MILQPCIIKAEEINYSNERSSNTWLGYAKAEGRTIPVEKIGQNNYPIPIGQYNYLTQEDSFDFGFSFGGCYGKFEDFFIVKDSILGKPVTEVCYQEYDYDNNFYFPGIYIADSVTRLRVRAFCLLQFPHIYLSNSIETIPQKCFSSNGELEKIILPANLKVIEENAFWGCTKLKFIKIPNKVTTIGKGAFEDCKNLTKIYLPASVKTIEKNAFKNCKKLTIYCEKNSYAYKYAKKNKIKVKLLSAKSVKAKQITNVPTSVKVGTQEESLLFPFVEPFYATNQKLAYISDNPSIADVNQNGKVEGKKKGTTTITVFSTDGSHLQKKIKVTVKQGKTTLNPYFTLFQLKKGTTDYNADAMLYNRNTKATYQLESSDSSIATAKVEKGILKVTAKKQGDAIFKVTEINGKIKNEIGSFPISVNTK